VTHLAAGGIDFKVVLFKQADMAMRETKNARKKRWVLYKPHES